MQPFAGIRSLSPTRQFGVAAVAMLLFAALLSALYFFVLRAEYRPLFKDLKAADAATIVAELDRTKTPYRLADSGATILIPEDRIDATRLEVMNANLPLKGAVGFEIFNESDMGLTEFAQRINYQRALQGELARTIMTIDSIDTARLHLTLGERALFREQRTSSKASVTVIPKSGKRIMPATVAGIQRLVAAAVPDLDVANVVVVDEAGRVISVDPTTDDVTRVLGPGMTPTEQYYVAKISQAIEAAYPGTDLQVVVTAGPGVPAEVAESEAVDNRRTFPLRVEIILPAPSALSEAEMRRTVTETIGIVAGDSITTTIRPRPMSSSTESVPETMVAPPITADDQSRASAWPTLWWALALAGGIMLVAIALLRRRSAPTLMTADERTAYAERLRMLLEKGANDGPRS